MRRRILCCVYTLMLLLTLSACALLSPPATPSPAPVAATPSPAPIPAPTPVPTPAPLGGFTALPVTEAAIHVLYQGEKQEILKIEAYQGDYLVWYCDDGGKLDAKGRFDGPSSFAWVFSATGRRVRMPIQGVVSSHEIIGTGSVQVITTGARTEDAYTGFPETYTLAVAGDANGSFQDESISGNACAMDTKTVWLPPEQGARLGMSRYEVVYDARVGLDDLTICFIPPATKEGFSEFVAAYTSVPYTTVSYDPATSQLTIKLTKTALTTGEEPEGADDSFYDFKKEYDISYPHTFPEGALGQANRFFTGPMIAPSGEDTVIFLTLTASAYRYTIETGQMSTGDMYPYLRIRFREPNALLDKAE